MIHLVKKQLPLALATILRKARLQRKRLLKTRLSFHTYSLFKNDAGCGLVQRFPSHCVTSFCANLRPSSTVDGLPAWTSLSHSWVKSFAVMAFSCVGPGLLIFLLCSHSNTNECFTLRKHCPTTSAKGLDYLNSHVMLELLPALPIGLPGLSGQSICAHGKSG